MFYQSQAIITEYIAVEISQAIFHMQQKDKNLVYESLIEIWSKIEIDNFHIRTFLPVFAYTNREGGIKMRNKFLAVVLPFIIVISLIAPIGAFAACGETADSSVSSCPEAYRGVDVSVWQGEIDFAKVRDSGIQAVYIRAAEGTNLIDRYFERNYDGARDAGLKYGFYHYVTARSVDEAKEQADFFARLIRTKPYNMRAAMDFENLSGLTPEEATAIAEAYLERLASESGHTPVFYTNAYDARSIWKSHFTKYPLWVADYGVREPYSIGGWRDWSGFQYNDKGMVNGIRGHVDMDHFRDDIFLTDDERTAADNIRRNLCENR